MQAVAEIQKFNGDDQVAANSAATYLEQIFSLPCQLGKGHQMPDGNWRFLVLCNIPEIERLQTVATLQIDGDSGQVIPWTDAEQRDATERILIAQAKARNRLPLRDGYIPQLFACQQANFYLGKEVGLLFAAIDPVFVPIDDPVWQLSIMFRLPARGDLGVLGTVDVDAKTGAVCPLNPQQIQQIQRRANAIARYQTQSTTS
ncbi:MAG: hypothetical protein KDE19_19230 [Caldilineaceae bacterium]|nr:hypothetical protein [Caldilineaceae bacterium]